MVNTQSVETAENLIETRAPGWDIPERHLVEESITFDSVLSSIKNAPRPVSLAEVAYNLTGNPYYQHHLNSVFSGKINAGRRAEAGLECIQKGRLHYWYIGGA